MHPCRGFLRIFPPAAVELMNSSVFKRFLVIMLNKATLLSPCLGPLDILAPLCKNWKGDCRHNSAQWLQAVLSILRLTGDQRGKLQKEWSLGRSVWSHESICNLLILLSMQTVFSRGVSHLLDGPTRSFLNNKAGSTDPPAPAIS